MITYFYFFQLVFPLQFTNLLGKVDVVAKVTGEGSSATTGAIRLGTSLALRSFVDDNMREKMRLGKVRWFLVRESGMDYKLGYGIRHSSQEYML